MPGLGDFLGAMLGELASARLRGDVETLRLADVYASHELLRHLPVPRFRMPEVRIDLPAIVEGGAGDPAAPIDTGRLTTVVVAGIRQKLEERQIALTRAQDTQLAKAVGQVIKDALAGAAPPPAQAIGDRVVQGVRKTLGRAITEEHAPMLQEMKAEIARLVVMERAAASRISIVPHTAAIREVPDADRLIRIHLVISEEAVEWTTLELEGGPQERLVQE